eukprot:7805297-Pyramimonas_sp.AAC.1
MSIFYGGEQVPSVTPGVFRLKTPGHTVGKRAKSRLGPIEGGHFDFHKTRSDPVPPACPAPRSRAIRDTVTHN